MSNVFVDNLVFFVVITAVTTPPQQLAMRENRYKKNDQKAFRRK